jgi:uncharacterized repeat protein (TIGR02543 family)
MSMNPVNSTSGYSYAEVVSLDTDGTLALQVGDRVAVKISGHNAAGNIPTASVGVVGGSEVGVAQEWSLYNGAVDLLERFFVITITEARTAAIRLSLTSGLTVVDMQALQVRPDAGETITVVDHRPAYGASATIQSGMISASGDDTLAIAGGWNRAGTALANEQIGGVAADGYRRSGRGGIWWRAFSSAQSDIRGTATFGDNDTWLADIIFLVSAVSGPVGHTLAYNANGATHGSAPASSSNAADAQISVAARPIHMVRFGYIFTGWNTAANGSGTAYAAGATLTMPDADVTLYAQWTAYVGGPRVIRNGTHDPASLTDAQVLAAAALKVYVEHASVGQDVFGDSDVDSSTGVDHNELTDLCGLALLYAQNPRYSLLRDHHASGYSAAWFSSHNGIQDNFRGNPGLAAKLSGFASSLSALGAVVGVAFQKECFIDASADPDADFDAIRSAHTTAQAANPGVVIPLVTIPIETAANTDHNPTSRQHSNVMIRQYGVENNLPLWDIADMQSDGGTEISGGRECMVSSYSSDGGHLNEAGKLKIGGSVWRLLSLSASILGGGIVASLAYTPTVGAMKNFNDASGTKTISNGAAKGTLAAAAVVYSLLGTKGIPLVTVGAGVTAYYSTDPELAMDSTSRNWTQISGALTARPAAIAFSGTGTYELFVGE